jgi:hypothetical protein
MITLINLGLRELYKITSFHVFDALFFIMQRLLLYLLQNK